jgi:signal transduction histidine kinase
LSFTVLPFFWQTWWFQISCLIGLLALTGGTIRAFERRRNQQRIERLEHEHAVERERMRIAKDLHDEMGPELTGITLLSDLAQGADAPPDEIKSDIRKIGDMSRGLSRSLSEIVWAVNPKNDSVESFVNYVCHFAEEYLRPAGIRCLLDIPDTSLTHELTMEVRHNLFMVIKEALNNVVKHAAATQVQLRFEMNAESFRLTLKDNGCGFKSPVAAMSESETHVTPRRPVGNGLDNMRHRIESLGGRFTLQSDPHAGTRIELELDFTPSCTGPRVTPFAYLHQKGDKG